jgi:hypothetical protein
LQLPAGSTIKAIGHYDNSTSNKYNPRPDAPVYWSEQSWDEMFNGWMELSVDRHVITRQAVYSLATPVNNRLSLGIGSGPPGTVYVRNADGSLVASAPIGAAASFIEPWTFARGQTIQTERAGTERGNVTVTLFDVPPDVERSTTIGGPGVKMTTEQPGQNAVLTFSGTASRQVAVTVTGNTMNSVTVRLLGPDQRVIAATTSSAAIFALPAVTLPSTGVHAVIVDPIGTAVGTLNVAVTLPGSR